MSTVKGYYTTAEAAEKTGTTTSLWVNRASGRGGYKPMKGAIQVGRSWLIPAKIVDEYVRDGRGRPAKQASEDIEGNNDDGH